MKAAFAHLRCDSGTPDRGWRVEVKPKAQVTEGLDSDLAVLQAVRGLDGARGPAPFVVGGERAGYPFLHFSDAAVVG